MERHSSREAWITKQNASAAHDLVQRLLALEAGANLPPDVLTVLRAYEKLRVNIAKMVGVAGFQVLIARALTLAKVEFPWLTSVEVEASGSLGGFEDAAMRQSAAEATQGGTALLSQVLELLMTFIGEALTLQLLHNIWSDIPWKKNLETEEIV